MRKALKGKAECGCATTTMVTTELGEGSGGDNIVERQWEEGCE